MYAAIVDEAKQSPMEREMVQDAAIAFEIYRSTGARSLRNVAAMLGIPAGTVFAWNVRYAWQARLRVEDDELEKGSFDATNAALARMRLAAVATYGEIMADKDAPHKVRLDAATRVLDRTGHASTKNARSFASSAPEADTPQAEIDDAVSAATRGDTDALETLIARARTQTLPDTR